MATKKVEIDLPVLEGYEYTGEYRQPEAHEAFLGNNNVPVYGKLSVGAFPILRKTEWRDATLEDLKRCPLPCRVRDYPHADWTEWCVLTGWSKTDEQDDMNWADGEEGYWAYCQVLDEETAK